MHDPSFSHRRARLGCRGGTFSPSRRQIRSTRLSLTSQPTAAELLPPAVVSHLAHPDRADRFRYALTLRGQNINLPQLGDDLFRLVAPPWHSGPPCEQNHSSGWTTSVGVDQYLSRSSSRASRGPMTRRRRRSTPKRGNSDDRPNAPSRW